MTDEDEYRDFDTLNDGVLGRLDKACMDLVRTGVCDMSCLAEGAQIGWCGECWTKAGEMQ